MDALYHRSTKRLQAPSGGWDGWSAVHALKVYKLWAKKCAEFSEKEVDGDGVKREYVDYLTGLEIMVKRVFDLNGLDRPRDLKAGFNKSQHKQTPSIRELPFRGDSLADFCRDYEKMEELIAKWRS